MLKRLQTVYKKLKRRYRNLLRASKRRSKWVKPMPPRYDEVYE